MGLTGEGLKRATCRSHKILHAISAQSYQLIIKLLKKIIEVIEELKIHICPCCTMRRIRPQKIDRQAKKRHGLMG